MDSRKVTPTPLTKQKGRVYPQDFINKVICGDCLEVMKQIPDKCVDLLLTDPPYEQDNHGGGKSDFAQRKLVKEKHINFISKGFDYEQFFPEIERVCRIVNLLIFCSNKQISKTMIYWEQKGYSTTLLVWKKPNAIPFGNGKYYSDTEYIVYVRGDNVPFTTGKSKVFNVNYPSKRLHPTQKPEILIKKLIEIHSIENGIILDPFLGSGTTAVACKELGRNFIGIEISPEYCKIAEQRLQQEVLPL